MSVEDRLSSFLGKKPTISNGVFIAPTAVVVGDVRLGEHSSVWYNAVLRGDINYISIGKETNIQDGVIGHLSDDHPLVVGNQVTVGHGAVIHACTIEDQCLIGMNATIINNLNIGYSTRIGAGSVVLQSQKPKITVFGNPAKQIGWVSEYGHRLNFHKGVAECIESGEKYILKNNLVSKQ